jgi:NAD+ diphosphatase
LIKTGEGRQKILQFTYCPQCGQALGSKILGDEGAVPYCENCQRPFFGFSYPCVIVAVLNEQHEIALIRQNWLTTANWVLVAGYIKPGETAEDCVLREVFEETGLKPYRAEYLSSYYHERRDCLMLAYIARVKKAEFGESPEVDAIAWFDMDEAGANLRPGSIAEKVYVEARRKCSSGPLDSE